MIICDLSIIAGNLTTAPLYSLCMPLSSTFMSLYKKYASTAYKIKYGTDNHAFILFNIRAFKIIQLFADNMTVFFMIEWNAVANVCVCVCKTFSLSSVHNGRYNNGSI